MRKRLAQYYVADGKDSRIRIEFSPGSYHATFSDVSKSRLDQAASAQAYASSDASSGKQRSLSHCQTTRKLQLPKRVHLRSRLLILGIAVIIVMGGVTEYERRPANPVRLFWSAILETPKPVLIYTGVSRIADQKSLTGFAGLRSYSVTPPMTIMTAIPRIRSRERR